MSLAQLPEHVRESQLIKSFAHKLESPLPVSFDYAGQLVRIVTQVTAEISQINRLFPEYTPHDAHYHVNRLFNIADRLIGDSRYVALNLAELFVFAAALYAHDWGMAVSDREREILKDLVSGKNRSPDCPCLEREEERIRELADKWGVSPAAIIDDIGLWREYVRLTHAERSGKRVRDFFAKEGGGVADAVARVAWAHGVNFSELERPDAFPPDFSVNGYTVDLRALAVYVRLVDLLDIADDRTPYAVWHFVAPRNPRSAMEWKKHRSLNPVTCPSYQNARKILIDGSTNDPEVWAELKDLGRYVEEQVRGCNDLLARIPDSRCHLDLHIVEWRIHPESFSPIDLRFDFDRDQTFKILSEEIYDGDCYVFLRELLQNSVDAIRMRQELLARNDVSMDGLIRFEVKRVEDGDVVVSCHDNGIGMDEYIVRHYLAMAGRSFYTSDDFKRYGLQMDAISRFGIGILSSFIAADEIEIETLRDPAISGRREPLRIHIPAINRQFRVYPGNSGARPGTRVSVRVRRKFLSNAPEGWRDDLRVADYLSRMAGFVDFPILVQEAASNVLIIHPDADEDAMKKRVMRSLNKGEIITEVRKKGAVYPWDLVFAPQDVQLAQAFFEVEWKAIPSLLGDIGQYYDGRIATLKPRSSEQIVMLCELHWREENYKHLEIYKKNALGEGCKGLRWVDDAFSRTNAIKESAPESVKQNIFAGVHYNGLVVPQASYNDKDGAGEWMLPPPLYLVNVKKKSNTLLNVARVGIREGAAPWRTDIESSFFNSVIKESLPDLRGMSEVERLLRIGDLRATYRIPAQFLAENLPVDVCPFVVFTKKSTVGLCSGDANLPDEVPLLPAHLDHFVGPKVREFLGLPLRDPIHLYDM